MRVLMISTDRNIFDEKSLVRARMIKYGTVVESLHILVLSKASDHFKDVAISENVFVYSTHSATRYMYPFDAIWKTKRLQIHFDMVTAQDPFECGLAAWRIARKFRVPFELQVHTDFASKYFKKESGLNRTRVRIAKFTLPRASAVRVVSERVASAVRPLTKAPITVLPIFVDINQISSTNPSFSLRAHFPDFTFIILMASRLTPEKDITTALHALQKVLQKYPKTGLVIVGEGFKREAIEADAKHHGIADHVKLLGWQNDLISYYKGASMFLLTSTYEGYGQVLVEAAAGNCPIVSTDVGIVGSVLKDNESVLVVPIGDADAVAEKISAFINDNDLRRRLAVGARDAVFTAIPNDFNDYLAKLKSSWEALLTPSISTK